MVERTRCEDGEGGGMSGKVYLVGAGPGDPDLITVRGLRALQQADLVLYDDLVAEALVRDLRAELIYVGKRCGRHAMPQEEISALLARFARHGKVVVRLKGGDPLVFGRGGEEAAELTRLGVDVELIPGVTSAIAAPETAGIPVTHRGVADAFTVVTAHRRADSEALSFPAFNPRLTVVVLMGVTTMEIWIAQLLRLGYPEALPAAFVMAGTTSEQRTVVTTLGRAIADAHAHHVESPCVAVVGEVVALRAALPEWKRLAEAAAA